MQSHHRSGLYKCMGFTVYLKIKSWTDSRRFPLGFVRSRCWEEIEFQTRQYSLFVHCTFPFELSSSQEDLRRLWAVVFFPVEHCTSQLYAMSAVQDQWGGFFCLIFHSKIESCQQQEGARVRPRSLFSIMKPSCYTTTRAHSFTWCLISTSGKVSMFLKQSSNLSLHNRNCIKRQI